MKAIKQLTYATYAMKAIYNLYNESFKLIQWKLSKQLDTMKAI